MLAHANGVGQKPIGFATLKTATYWNEQFARFTPKDIALAFLALSMVLAEVISNGPLLVPLSPVFLVAIAAILGWNSLELQPRYRRALAFLFVGATGFAATLSPALAQFTFGTPAAACSTGLLGPLASYVESLILAISSNPTFASQACLLFQLFAVLIVVAIIGAFIYLAFQVRDGSEFRVAANPLFMAIIIVVGIGLSIRFVLGV